MGPASSYWLSRFISLELFYLAPFQSVLLRNTGSMRRIAGSGDSKQVGKQ